MLLDALDAVTAMLRDAGITTVQLSVSGTWGDPVAVVGPPTAQVVATSCGAAPQTISVTVTVLPAGSDAEQLRDMIAMADAILDITAHPWAPVSATPTTSDTTGPAIEIVLQL